MRSSAGARRGSAVPPAGQASVDRLRDLVAELSLEAGQFIAADRVEAIARHWLARPEAGQGSPRDEALLVADALGTATDLALFTPSASGATAFDRLARSRGRLPPDEAAALEALRQARFRVLRLETLEGDGGVRLCDLAFGDVLLVLDETMPPDAIGVALVGRLALLGDGHHVFVSGVAPLDETGLTVATGFIRSARRGDGHGLVSAQRCAEAVYCYVLRHGTPEIAGLNRPLEGEGDGFDDGDAFPFDAEEGELDAAAHRRAAADDAHPDPGGVQLVRSQVDLGTSMDMVVSVAMARDLKHSALDNAYAAIVPIQIETVQRREEAESGSARLDAVAAALDAAIAASELPLPVRGVFAELRGRVRTAQPGNAGARSGDSELERLIGRVQGLRAKMVEQGCTEQEALAAAEKVAELLDRHRLSLSELDVCRQPCTGAGIETGRRRLGPIGDCVLAIAAFFDCQVWGENDPAGRLRYVFFGLPADVEATRYLYDLVERAFETETARFRAGAIYAEAHTLRRHTASTSFQVGLARGIVAKMHKLRLTRATALRGSTGRDPVAVKESIVDEELAKLDLHLRARIRAWSGRPVHGDAFEAGHDAGHLGVDDHLRARRLFAAGGLARRRTTRARASLPPFDSLGSPLAPAAFASNITRVTGPGFRTCATFEKLAAEFSRSVQRGYTSRSHELV